jgi:hypothetical protein
MQTRWRHLRRSLHHPRWSTLTWFQVASCLFKWTRMTLCNTLRWLMEYSQLRSYRSQLMPSFWKRLYKSSRRMRIRRRLRPRLLIFLFKHRSKQRAFLGNWVEIGTTQSFKVPCCFLNWSTISYLHHRWGGMYCEYLMLSPWSKWRCRALAYVTTRSSR